MIFSASTLSIGSYFASCIFNSFLEETDVLLTPAATFTRVYNYLQHISSQHGSDLSRDMPFNIMRQSSIIFKSPKRTERSFLDSYIYFLHTQITMHLIYEMRLIWHNSGHSYSARDISKLLSYSKQLFSYSGVKNQIHELLAGPRSYP